MHTPAAANQPETHNFEGAWLKSEPRGSYRQRLKGAWHSAHSFGPPADKSRGPESIVDQAKAVLRGRFRESRGMWLLDGAHCDLGRLMTEANTALAANGLPQLGRNPAWLVPENDNSINGQA